MITLSMRNAEDDQNRHQCQNYNTFYYPVTIFVLSVIASILVSEMVFPLVASSSPSYLPEYAGPPDEEDVVSIREHFLTQMSRSQLGYNMAPQLGTTSSGAKEHRYSNIRGGDHIDEPPDYQEEGRYHMSYKTIWAIGLYYYFDLVIC